MDADISGYKVHITDMERSVCDAVKYRNKIGLDVCAEVIRTYLKKPNRNLARLQDYAKRLRVFKIMGRKNYGKSVKTRLLNLMNETGYKYMVSSGKILQRETALQGFCKPVQGQILVERRFFALCHEWT